MRKLQLALVFFSTLVATSARADFYRLHTAHVGPMLDNIEAHPEVRGGVFRTVDLHIVVTHPTTQLDQARVLADRARSLGLRVWPGFRTMESRPLGGSYADADRWQRNAAWVRQHVAAFGLGVGDRLCFDVENYADAVAPTFEELKLAMEPFVAAVLETGIVPCIYPAIVDATTTRPEKFATLIVGDALEGRFEAWVERAFGLSETYRASVTRYAADVQALAKIRTDFAARWPSAIVRHGLNDDVLRNWGAPFRAAGLGDIGVHAPWYFDARRIDNNKIGSPDWLTGESLHPLNSTVRHVWRLPGASKTGVTSVTSSVKLTLVSWDTTKRADIKSDHGWLLTEGRPLLASGGLPVAGDFTLVAEFILPRYGDGPIVGACQSNHESWQLLFDSAADQIVLELRHAFPATTRVPVVVSPPRGAPIRVLVGRAGTDWVHATPTAYAVTKPPPVKSEVGNLWVGAGTDMRVPRARWVFSGDLVVSHIDVWFGTLTESDAFAALAQPYPRQR